MTNMKLEVDDDVDISMIQQKVQPNDDDIDQLEKIEKKENESILENYGDNEIFELMAKFSEAHTIDIRAFEYDKDKFSLVKIRFEAPIKFKNVDMTNIVREMARTAVIHEIQKINRAFVHRQKDVLVVTTEGINIGVSRLIISKIRHFFNNKIFQAMFQYDKILNLNKLYTNDIHAVAKTYGIEAAARVIIKEVQNVFNVYGITVDPRHLSLISDYMTFDGSFKPLNRKGIETSASPLQQISFESAMTFLKTAVINGRVDAISSPSSCLMVGQPCKTGTGAFGLVNDLTSLFSTKTC